MGDKWVFIPGTSRSASLIVTALISSSCWRVVTVTANGAVLSNRSVLVAVVTLPFSTRAKMSSVVISGGLVCDSTMLCLVKATQINTATIMFRVIETLHFALVSNPQALL